VAFDRFIEDVLNHLLFNDIFAPYCNASSSMNVEEKGFCRIVTRFHDLVSRRRSLLPNENCRKPPTIVTDNQILRPLLRNDPITLDVLEGVLYLVFPDVFDIIEHESHSELQNDLCRLTSPQYESSVVVHSEEKLEPIIVGTFKRKPMYMKTRLMNETNSRCNLPADWIILLYNLRRSCIVETRANPRAQPITVDLSIVYTL
jgi:hypothetical protein